MISKNRPIKYVTSKDERLLGPGSMTEAVNVTVRQSDDGNESLLKPMKGVRGIIPDTGEEILDDEVVVIGKAEDHQQGYVYFFVSGKSVRSRDMIVRLNPADRTYKVVFKSSFLNFLETSFIKADVINKAFQQDGVVQTVLYFTDNVNPPRKINVTEALDGRYTGMNNSQLDIALSVIRPPVMFSPEVIFSTDRSIEINNFKRDIYQFATQLVYRDGEESVLSPYSKTAIPEGRFYDLLDGGSGGSLSFSNNICEINTGYEPSNYSTESSTKKEVRLMRVYGRRGNAGSFFLIDEFDPNVDLTRSVHGTTNYVVYDSTSKVYKFFNDQVGSTISDTLANKNYDNVPKLAEGQAIAASRLMYSNYTEGYENRDMSGATLSVQYGDEAEASTIYISQSNANSVISDGANSGKIEIDLSQGTGISGASTVIKAGTQVSLEFKWDATGDITNDEGGIGTEVATLFFSSSEGTYSAGSSVSGSTIPNNVPVKGVADDIVVKIDFVVGEDTTASGLGTLIRNKLSGYRATKVCNATGSEFQAKRGASDIVDIRGDYTLEFDFGTTNVASPSNCGQGHFIITPRLSRVDVKGMTDADAGVTVNNLAIAGNTEDNCLNSVYRPGGADEDDLDFTSSAPYVVSGTKVASAESFDFSGSFKRGASHDFGVVYYDKWGRSSFVNKVGSAFVKPFASSAAGSRGSVSVKITPSGEPPTWADTWQPVYTGNTTYESFLQYTTGGAYPVYKGAPGSRVIDTNKKQLYVSIHTLQNYVNEKSALREYSFTQGDKLRVLSYDSASSASESVVYPHANNSDTFTEAEPIIEFEIVDLVTLDGTIEGNPIYGGNPDQEVADEFQGTFLVLESSLVASGIQDPDISEQVKYEGFDWFSVTNTAYPSGDASGNTNFWGRRSIVEIVTPATSEKNLYYEVGEPVKINRREFPVSHGSVTLTKGDVYYRPLACNTNFYSSGWLPQELKNYRYQTELVESSNISDISPTEDWDRGRSHVAFERAAEINRYNGITYSDAYEDDVAKLSLSSFTPSAANFFDLPSEYGACTAISVYSDRLLSLQENKCHLIGLNKDVIQTGAGQGIVALSTNVMQSPIPYAQDLGTSNPESVLVVDTRAFFVDSNREHIVMIDGTAMKSISEIDIESTIEDDFATWKNQGGDKLISGYDPVDRVYYVTFNDAGSFSGRTLGYDVDNKFWQGEYTFIPDIYARNGKYFIIGDFQDVPPDDDSFSDSFAFVFDDNNSYTCKFPPTVTTTQEAKFTVVSNEQPSTVKSFESISIEGDKAWAVTLESSAGQKTSALSFEEKEDAFYARVGGATDSSSTANYLPIGTVDSVDGSVITMKNSLRGIHIPKGYSLAKNSGSSAFSNLGQTITSVNVGDKEITASTAPLVVDGDRLFAYSAKEVNGNQIRGHYCKIKATVTADLSDCAIYSVNAKYSESKANHGLAQ